MTEEMGSGAAPTDYVSKRETAKGRVRRLIREREGGVSRRELGEALSDLYSYGTAINIVADVLKDMSREAGGVGPTLVRSAVRGSEDALSREHKRLGTRVALALDGSDEAKERLASRAGLGSKAMVTKLCEGRLEVTLSQLKAIAAAMEVPLSSLVAESGPCT